MDKSELYRELRKATKQANQRLVRIEQKGGVFPAYRIAQNDITNILGKQTGKPRFRVNKSMSYAEMERELKYANKFLTSASSTVTGMKRVVKQRNETLYKRYGIKGAKKLNTLYNILSSDAYRKATELLPSSMVVSSVIDAVDSGANDTDISGVLNRLTSEENDGYLLDSLDDMLSELT